MFITSGPGFIEFASMVKVFGSAFEYMQQM